jgi:transcription-repair coupling factor (superfamily II helicase)
MRDLSIRGAGDILGREQSGFIDTIGIDLYLKMLNDAIKKSKGEEVKTDDNENKKNMLIITCLID